MKLIVAIIDGMADCESFNKWIFSSIKSLSFLNCGIIKTNRQEIFPETTNCVLNLMTNEEKAFSVGRSFFEILALGESLKEDESSLRLNLVSTNKKGVLSSFNSPFLNKNQQEEAFNALKESFPNVFPLSSYRAVAKFKTKSLLNSPLSLPPHENLGQNYNDLIKKNIDENPFLKEEIGKINYILSAYSFDEGFLKIFPYSKQENISIKSFESQFLKKAKLIADFETVVGIGKALSLETCLKKSIKEKGEKLREALKEENTDILFLHINDLDEASHNKDIKGKKALVRLLDKEVFKVLSSQKLPFIILSDHITNSETGRHEKGSVPFYTNLPLTPKLTAADLKNLYKNI